jgi:hypothetical protein
MPPFLGVALPLFSTRLYFNTMKKIHDKLDKLNAVTNEVLKLMKTDAKADKAEDKIDESEPDADDGAGLQNMEPPPKKPAPKAAVKPNPFKKGKV